MDKKIIEFNDYKDKVLGCWWGKYAGGVMGMPFEGKRGVVDLDWYIQDNLQGIDNDDIDLQLVWLRACEKYGNKVNSQILAEFWLTYICGNPSEYGTAKNNLRIHMPPPLSGHFGNTNKDSNGGFIRSEIWACLCAGNPDIAVRYAIEDAMVDHSGEGVYAEVFMAALQAEAFVERDIFRLIDKALRYIPEGCGVAKGANCAVSCYRSGKSWKEARKEILRTVPSGFTYGNYYDGQKPEEDIPLGPTGYDAPCSIALILMSILYGEYDFKKTICIAAGCMEDADCTAGSAGSAIGIILGYESLPKDVLAPLGEKIATGSIRLDGDLLPPKTIKELAERVIRITPIFLGETIVDTLSEKQGYTIEAHVSDTRFLRHYLVNHERVPDFKALLERIPSCPVYRGILFDTALYYDVDAFISEGEDKKVRFVFWNNIWADQWLTCKWHLPQGISVKEGKTHRVLLSQRHGGHRFSPDYNCGSVCFTLTMEDNTNHEFDCILEIISEGRYTRTFIPMTLYKRNMVFDEN